jgi:2-oxoglutarate dehydrogenase E1 component
LEAAREKIGARDIAILRVEQFHPFPFKEVIKQLEKYNKAKVTWA